jgi:hypothetical protein
MKRMIGWEICIGNHGEPKQNGIHHLLAIQAQGNCLTHPFIAKEIGTVFLVFTIVSIVIRCRHNAEAEPFHRFGLRCQKLRLRIAIHLLQQPYLSIQTHRGIEHIARSIQKRRHG